MCKKRCKYKIKTVQINLFLKVQIKNEKRFKLKIKKCANEKLKKVQIKNEKE